ncbi:aminoglycoside phosphotransferase [Actinophytocola xinjiangensis]|uniref:Aminoglycoside phosphotransferase n=1 Tax=Actinophytocola xinjiangensis TaxID=485602 RepID=A0A7Z1AY41_9PSEU|nr:aminoglycoside phosphotransferase family protein [Actinophytocola xinjiangensis]OLF10070.1 aminoglycoside phosphotransferase [Actinophytocola xinjiangensis]
MTSRETVRALLTAQHPDLAHLELREVDGGWDNKLWRLGDELGVRVPVSERAPGLLRAEQRWLPELAARLPLPTPVPVRVGEPSALFDRTWTVTRWVHGEPADRVPISTADSAEALAGFLTALHRPAPPDAPRSPTRGVPLADLRDGFTEALTVLDDDRIAGAAREVWDKAVAAAPWSGAPVWLHGDLHPANVVVRAGRLAGVVDFGDLSVGDPATDLAAAWVLLPEAGPFLDRYTFADDATVARSRGWAVLRALILIAIGRDGRLGLPGGKPTWEPAGHAALSRALA